MARLPENIGLARRRGVRLNCLMRRSLARQSCEPLFGQLTCCIGIECNCRRGYESHFTLNVHDLSPGMFALRSCRAGIHPQAPLRQHRGNRFHRAVHEQQGIGVRDRADVAGQ